MEKTVNLKKEKFVQVVRSYILMISLVGLIIIVSILEPAFLTGDNMVNILRQCSVIGVCALGVTFVLIEGGMDLSLGSNVSLCSVVAISVMNYFNSIGANTDAVTLLAIVLAVGVGFCVGLANGTILAAVNGRMGESFIVTYSMQIMIAALALLITGGQFMTATFGEGFYTSIGTGWWPIVIFIVLIAVLQFVLTKTRYGRQICYMGANMDAAKMSGINVKKLRPLNYGLCGACAGLAAIMVTARVTSASPLQGVGYELDAIAAAVVGGTSLTGGSGSIIKTALGVLVIAVLGNALNVMGVNANAQFIVKGAIIILAVGIDVWNRQAKERSVRNEPSNANA